MEMLPADDFLKRFNTPYGISWSELFAEITNTPAGAKHMAEFIDDIEMYGQQSPVFVDKQGIVSDGNKVALALWVMSEEITFAFADPPLIAAEQVWQLEFDVDNGKTEELCEALVGMLSFRIDDDWVMPLEAEIEENSFSVEMYCPTGEFIAAGLGHIVADRLMKRFGISICGVSVSEYVPVDEDTVEW